MANYQLYRNTTLGVTLQDTLDDMISVEGLFSLLMIVCWLFSFVSKEHWLNKQQVKFLVNLIGQSMQHWRNELRKKFNLRYIYFFCDQHDLNLFVSFRENWVHIVSVTMSGHLYWKISLSKIPIQVNIIQQQRQLRFHVLKKWKLLHVMAKVNSCLWNKTIFSSRTSLGAGQS